MVPGLHVHMRPIQDSKDSLIFIRIPVPGHPWPSLAIKPSRSPPPKRKTRPDQTPSDPRNKGPPLPSLPPPWTRPARWAERGRARGRSSVPGRPRWRIWSKVVYVEKFKIVSIISSLVTLWVYSKAASGVSGIASSIMESDMTTLLTGLRRRRRNRSTEPMMLRCNTPSRRFG